MINIMFGGIVFILYLCHMKLLDFLAVRLISKDTESAVKVYNALYSQPRVVYKPQPKPQPQPKPVVKVVEKIVYVPSPATVEPNPSPKPVTKKEELLESLQYLTNKKSKTKQDRESIDIIKSILKNMK
jgi:hypothetical protein